MKHLNLLALITSAFFLSLFSNNVHAQTEADSLYYKRLYYVGKIWGHAKYFHKNIADGNVDWDTALIEIIPKVKSAQDSVAFNDALMELLNKAGAVPPGVGTKPSVPDSLNFNLDKQWMEDQMLSEEVRQRLKEIDEEFRPQENVYINTEEGYSLTFIYDSGRYYPYYFFDEVQLLSLFRYWNIIYYFFPYRDITDVSWNDVLIKFIPRFAHQLEVKDYHLLFIELATHINDSHGVTYSQVFFDYFGSAYFPFQVRFIEGQTVITKVLDSINEVKVGDIITSIDGQEIEKIRNDLRKYAYGSNDAVIERTINNFLLRGKEGEFEISVFDGKDEKSVRLERNFSNIEALNQPEHSKWRQTISKNNCQVGIVDMGILEVADVATMLSELEFSDFLIFDVRNYPKFTVLEIVKYFYLGTLHFATFMMPQLKYPGAKYMSIQTFNVSNSLRYYKPIVVLFDERTQSHAEYTVMAFEQLQRVTKIGSSTAGADGNITRVYLPGGITTTFTLLGTFYPDFTPTQRVGIIPDIEVRPTIQGIRDGRDEVMEVAMNHHTCSPVDKEEESIVSGTNALTFYPHPVSDKIYLNTKETSLEYQLGTIEVFDVLGRKVKQLEQHKLDEPLEITALSKGLYILRVTSGKVAYHTKFIKN